MANLAQIQSIAQGQFFVKDSLGNLTELKVGDTVSLNDTIVAASSNTDLSKIEILFDTNELITLSQGEQLLDATLLASTFGNEELAFDKQEVDETLNAWNNAQDGDATDMETAAGDVTEQATNAGDERAADGGALRSKFNSRTGDSTDVRSDLRDTSFGGGNPENPQEQIPTELLNPVDTRVPASVITLSDPIVKEGNQITITATVTNPPQTDLIITLNNGQTITIPAGQTAGSVTFDNPNSEDVYIDNSTETYTITGTTGGNYVSLDTSDSSVVTIEDTPDTTTVKISGTDTTEGGKATFELELSNKPQTGTTATGKVEVDGKSYDVTFDADGKATLTVDVKANDVYNGEPTLTAKVTEISGGNFEKVNPNAQKTITVKDTPDTTTVKISGTDTTEGGKATFELELSNKPQTGTTATGKVEVDGKSYDVTFDADGKATLTVDVKANDVYNGEPTLTAKVTEISGGNFEKVNPNAQKTITVKDTPDTTTVKITANPVQEGQDIVFTATVDADKTPKTDLVISVKDSNGNEVTTITILKGQTTGSSNPVTNPNTDDVYKDGETLNYTTEVKSGGTEYEKLNTTPVSVVVTDTITPIDVTITATVTTPKIIDVNTKTDGTTGVKVTGYNSDGKETNLSIIKGTNHDGFGVDGKNLSNGDTKELGVGEKIVVEFTGGKDVNSLDVSFAWRNNHETAKLTFVKGGQVVGYATVDGDGKSTTKAFIQYYDDKEVKIGNPKPAEGSSDRVDKAFTFELPDSNGGIVSFDKVEFSAPKNKDDYLIHKISYKEVLNTEVTDIITDGGNVTFNIQVDENYPPQGKAYAYVSINGGAEIKVELNSTGRGTLTIDSKELGDLSKVVAKVIRVDGGKYEQVKEATKEFDFTPSLKTTDDSITTNEDVPYTLTINDFGDITGISTKTEFKIRELPTNGNLFLTITTGETIFDKEGNKIKSTKDETIQISKNQILTLGQISDGKVTFIPTKDTDADSKFSFKIGQDGDFAGNYTTTIIVNAVADAPTVSIDVKNGNPITKDNSVSIKTLVDTPMKEVALTVTVTDERNANNSVINDKNIYEAQNGNNHTNGHLAFKNVNSSSFNIKNDLQKPIIIFGNQNKSTFDVNGTIKFVGGLDAESISNASIIINNTIDTIKISKNFDGTFSGKIGNTIITNVKAIAYKGGVIGELFSFNSNSFEIDYDAIKNQNLVEENGQYFKVTTETNTEIVGYKYEIEYSAKLTDTDGSEKLSDFIIKNLPECSKLFGADKQEILANKDGSYTVKVDENGKAKLTLESQDKLSEDELNSIKASATSTENSNGDSATTTVSENLGNDIDLSGLKSILEEQETGDINLSNNSQDKLTLTLDDVLKLSGDDGKIKITGDQFDSVAFKNTTGENGQAQTWSKTSGEGEDAGFDIYVNSGDESLKVKVEQPISDGITN